ncbi:MAG: TrmH family RNA methyltransferase [Bulleidia sp.]
MEMITSLQNAKVKRWTSYHKKKDRDKDGRFLVEGEHLIQEAGTAGILETVITDLADQADDSMVVVTPAVMNKLSENVSAVHWIGVCRKKTDVPKQHNRVLILDGIQDPGNLGTLIRTACSFSFDVIYVSKQTCDLYNDKTIRSTQGALFHIPVISTDIRQKIAELKQEGVQCIATSLEQSKTMREIPAVKQMAFVLGNEGQGVSRQVMDLCDERLRIEMHGFESLNVAVAGGIVMYTYRQD